MTTKTAALPPLTADELAALPPRIDAATAARALGISRQSLYALIRADKAPIEVLDVGGYSFRSADLRRYLLGDQPPAVDLAAKVDELLAAHLESVRLLGILVAATTTTQIGRAS